MTTLRPLTAETEPAATAAVRRTRWGLLVPIAATVLTAVLTAVTDVWFLPFAAGLLLGALIRGRARAVVAAALAGGGGWALVLLWRMWSGEPISGAARVTAALAALPPSAALIIAATLLIALLQALCGVWLGRGLAALIQRRPA
jgi:hypothetical protein